MARKYKFHRWYSVTWWDNSGMGIHCRDNLTLKEARNIAGEAYDRGALRVDIVKRMNSKNKVDGVIKLEEI